LSCLFSQTFRITLSLVKSLVKSIASSSYPSSSPSRKRLAVQITPFSLILSTNETKIDIDELDTILTDHLLEQMQANLPKSTEVSKVDLLLTDITLIHRNLKKDEERQGSQAKGGPGTSPEKQEGTIDNAHLTSSSAHNLTQVEPTKTTTHEISVGGDAYFAGNALPTTEQLDDVTKSSFEGKAGNKFVKNLLSADDPGLQSTVSISVPIDTSDTQLNEGFLFNEQTEARSSESANNAVYIVGVLFVAGLLLVAAFVHRRRHSQRGREQDIDDFVEEVRAHVSFLIFNTCSSPTFSRHSFYAVLQSRSMKTRKTLISLGTLTSIQLNRSREKMIVGLFRKQQDTIVPKDVHFIPSLMDFMKRHHKLQLRSRRIKPLHSIKRDKQ